jgi:hypothetical protein
MVCPVGRIEQGSNTGYILLVESPDVPVDSDLF